MGLNEIDYYDTLFGLFGRDDIVTCDVKVTTVLYIFLVASFQSSKIVSIFLLSSLFCPYNSTIYMNYEEKPAKRNYFLHFLSWLLSSSKQEQTNVL